MRRIFMIIFLAGILTGCANVSRFEVGTLVAHGEQLNGSHEPLYYSISIDVSGEVDHRIMGVLLKLTPDANPLKLSELSPELVANFLPKFIPPPQWPEQWKKKAKEEDAYSGGGFHIKFKKGRLKSVGICSHCSGGLEHPIIGTGDGKAFYSLPLTEQQLIDVFGQPSRVYKVNEVRY